ncbi:site-specific integrase [Sinomonas sp. JGH33]|uniref:Site-specific integrase n=1 Tax=Sinomonas terricola TaxID=3110330 RepID=A0ABU5T0T2_9MICC|nr:site-specific integrase [Sinomonas sp. JGH33]MEA5453250.1 site-specific integrase [Sinomonas sp. JGH33]
MSPTRGKGEGAVYQRSSDGLWCVSIELPGGVGRSRKVVCRKTKGNAIEALRALQDELARTGDIAKSTMQLSVWLDYWLPNISAPRNEPGTTKNQRGHINKWIAPALGRLPLSKLTPTHVRQLHKAVRDGGGSSTLVVQVHATLSVALRDAVREGKMRQNPCDLMDRPKGSTAAQKALTLEQTLSLFRYVMTRPLRHDWALWAAYLLTGTRRGELLGLEADRVGDVLDLSWQLQRITNIEDAPPNHVYRNVGGNLYLKKPKTKAGTRIIPLVDPLLSILAMHMEGRGPGLVFTEPDGSAIKPDEATRRWKKILAKAGLPEDVKLHGTRHTTVDLLAAAGVPAELRREIIGHSTREMTEAYRTKGNLPELTAAMKKMSALLSDETSRSDTSNTGSGKEAGQP